MSSKAAKTIENKGVFVPYGEEELRHYYEICFPARVLSDWYGYGDLTYFSRREFAYTSFDELYARWNSYADAPSWRRELLERSPAKIHVGAVYNDEPRNHTKVQTFVPIEKELVFDIDANDYDDILDSALRKDFGFKHIIWVFSGRRGVHGWVCDKKARSLTQEGRSSVASYLAVNNVQALKTLHPSLKRAYDKVLLPYFESMIGSNDLLMIEDANAKLFSLTKDTPAIEAQVRDSWNQDNVLTSDDRWREFKKILVDSKRFDLLHAIVFHFSYPRLDIQVSKQWNHLLKAPMTVHPSTGMVCVPITCREVSSRTGFDPTTTPRIHEVVQEVDLIVKSNGVDVATALRQTSLQRYLEILNEFVIGLSKERRQAKNAMQGVEDAF